jgi:hypothetical protein
MYSQLGGRQFRQVRPSTIQAWLRGLGLADSTTKVVFANLSTLFAAAVNDELIGRNPCRSLRTQSEGRAARRPAVDQADLTEGPPAGDVDQLAGYAARKWTRRWAGPGRMASGRRSPEGRHLAGRPVGTGPGNLCQVPDPVESPDRDSRAMIRTGTATATATTAWVTAVRMYATRATSTALASKTTGYTSGGPGLA